MEAIEVVILGSFVVLQVTFHKLQGFGEHPVVVRLRSEPKTAWMVHPTLWEGLRDYAVHIVVYSGYIISKH